MSARSLMRHFRPFAILIVVLAAFALSGCGDDDPTNPGGGSPPDSFDQATATGQAQASAVQAVDLVESMADIAAGFTKDGEKDYAWNAETQRWEFHYTYSGEGYTYDWLYTVQYRGADGEPQQTAQGAASVAHAMTGTGSYSQSAEGATLRYDSTYDYATTITGFGTGTLVMTGGGGQGIDYDYRSPQGNHAATYAVGWEIMSPGITISGQDGCPTGAIRYDFAPYYSLVQFNGSTVATSTLYSANGSVVSGGGSSHPLSCSTQ